MQVKMHPKWTPARTHTMSTYRHNVTLGKKSSLFLELFNKQTDKQTFSWHCVTLLRPCDRMQLRSSDATVIFLGIASHSLACKIFFLLFNLFICLLITVFSFSISVFCSFLFLCFTNSQCLTINNKYNLTWIYMWDSQHDYCIWYCL